MTFLAGKFLQNSTGRRMRVARFQTRSPQKKYCGWIALLGGLKCSLSLTVGRIVGVKLRGISLRFPSSGFWGHCHLFDNLRMLLAAGLPGASCRRRPHVN